jgi:hypothetical protein
VNKRKRLLTFSIALLMLTVIPNLATSEAGLNSKAFNSSTMSLGTGKYMAAAVTTTGAGNPGTTLALTLVKNVPQYWYVKNFGDYTINSFTLGDTVVVGGGGNIAVGICVGGTGLFTGRGTCGGGGTYTLIATLVNGANTNTITQSITAGSTLEIEYKASRNSTDTVSIAVSRSDIRSGTNTNS